MKSQAKKCEKCGRIALRHFELTICQDCGIELWKQAKENAKAEYEEEYGTNSWEERADKYEREDYTFAAFEKLTEEWRK